MRLLYIGDIMGPVGVDVVTNLLPDIRLKENIDIVFAQAENVSNGKGISQEDYLKLKAIGIDFFTAGNWTLNIDSIYPFLNDPNEPIIRPANYPKGTTGLGWKYLETKEGKVLVVSLLGQIVGRDSDKLVDNPLSVIDEILESEKTTEKIATVVNFHGDYSSEKIVIGHYLDGRVTAVIGDHWHVPTADERVLPKGTAHQTDVGMCGPLNSSLGVKLDAIYSRWKDSITNKNELELGGPKQFNGLIVDFDTATGLAKNVKRLQTITD